MAESPEVWETIFKNPEGFGWMVLCVACSLGGLMIHSRLGSDRGWHHVRKWEFTACTMPLAVAAFVVPIIPKVTSPPADLGQFRFLIVAALAVSSLLVLPALGFCRMGLSRKPTAGPSSIKVGVTEPLLSDTGAQSYTNQRKGSLEHIQPEQDSAPGTETGGDARRYRAVTKLNVRQAPNMQAAKLRSIGVGELVWVLETSQTAAACWGRIGDGEWAMMANSTGQRFLTPVGVGTDAVAPPAAPHSASDPAESSWPAAARLGASLGARAFVLARHPRHGLLLLQASKRKKGVHYQLPGGHVDRPEIEAHGLESGCRAAAARELFEETGIDVRADSHRLRAAALSAPQRYNGRFYFELELSDDDGVGAADGGVQPLSAEPFCEVHPVTFLVRLSHEHTAWRFEPDVEAAAKAVHAHSGGYNSMAIRETLRR